MNRTFDTRIAVIHVTEDFYTLVNQAGSIIQDIDRSDMTPAAERMMDRMLNHFCSYQGKSLTEEQWHLHTNRQRFVARRDRFTFRPQGR